MALDLNSIEGVANVVERGESALNFMSIATQLDIDNLIDKTIIDLDKKIKDMSQQKDNFLDQFGCKGNPELFKTRVAEYYNNYNLTTFTGKSLKTIVDQYKNATDIKLREKSQLIENMIYNLISSNLMGPGQNKILQAFQNDQVTQEIADEVINTLLGALSNSTLGKGGTLTASSFAQYKSKSGGKGALEIAAGLTTTAFDAHVDSLQKLINSNATLRGLAKDSPEYEAIKTARILLKPVHGKANFGNESLSQTLGVTWSDITSNATTGKTGKGSDIKSNAELTKVNEELTIRILDELHLQGKDREFVQNRIKYMLGLDEKMFFVGRSYAQLEGILGELSAVVAITALLGDKYRDKAFHWIGSQRGVYSKKQPSIDIVLKEVGGIQYGIQVKNTIDDLSTDFSHYISFAEKPVDDIFNLFGGLDPLKDVYTSDAYNVPYKRIGSSYSQVGPNTTFSHDDPSAERFPLYIELDERIDSIVQKMNLYFTQFAPDFLYMGLDQMGFSSQLATLDLEVIETGGNYVYIVGPTVTFADEMLTKLMEELKALKEIKNLGQQLSFKLEATFDRLRGEKQAFNIVSYLNGKSKGGLESHQTKLRSSWGF